MSFPQDKPIAQLLIEHLVGPNALAELEAASRRMQEAFSGFLIENPNFLSNLQTFIDGLRDLPEKQRQAWSEAAQLGWYPNSESSIIMKSELQKGPADLDQYMILSLRADWPLLTAELLAAHPERREILECAFQLHAEGRYIASVPLFLAQADGICAHRLGAHLFTDQEEREEKLTQLAANSNEFTRILIGLLGLKTQFTAGISKASPKRKALAPNRNGILHGSRRHLDYGTEANSFKAFSLLTFVAYVFSDLDATSDA